MTYENYNGEIIPGDMLGICKKVCTEIQTGTLIYQIVDNLGHAHEVDEGFFNSVKPGDKITRVYLIGDYRVPMFRNRCEK